MMNWLMTVTISTLIQHEESDQVSFYVRVMEALEKLDVIDADFCGDIETGPVEIAFVLEDEEFKSALDHGLTAVRTAIHDAGGSTSGWPNCDDLEPESDGRGSWVVMFGGSGAKTLQSV